MRYNYNGRNINIPDDEIQNSMKLLGLSESEAVQMWLEDNDYEKNETVEALTEKAKGVKIRHDARSDKPRQNSGKPRERKPDTEKESLIETLAAALQAQGISVEITNKSKIITFSIGENHYKLDLIKQCPPKTEWFFFNFVK